MKSDPWARPEPKGIPTEYENVVPKEAPKSEPIAEVSNKPDSDANTPPEYKKEELLPLLDGLLQNGYVINEFGIRSTKVILRSRFAWEDQEIFSRLDAEKVNTAIAFQHRMQVLTLAAGLVQYGNSIFQPKNVIDKKDFDERLEFILSLPTPIVDIIYENWFKFNAKYTYLTANIDALLKDF